MSQSCPGVHSACRAATAIVILLLLLAAVPAHADQRLAPAALAKVKGATSHLRVTLPGGDVAEGSGFFGVEPGLVLTNAHVLGMLRPESRRPLKIEVTVRSGEKDAKTYTAQVLGVDRSTDLAVLRVTGRDLPPPLPVVSAKGLMETQGTGRFRPDPE